MKILARIFLGLSAGVLLLTIAVESSGSSHADLIEIGETLDPCGASCAACAGTGLCPAPCGACRCTLGSCDPA